MTNPSKKASANLQLKQKRKTPEDTTDKTTQQKSTKKARKDDVQTQTEPSKIITKTTPKIATATAKAVTKDEPKKRSHVKPSLKPSTKTKKAAKVVPSPEEDSESQEESDSSDAESEVIQVKDVNDVVEEIDDDEKDKENEDEDHLVGFSSEEDSSDEELDQNADSVDISTLPSVVKGDAALKKRLDNAKAKQSEERGVIYLGRIPHGLYEDEMRGYFSQFGDVTRIRLSRNKKLAQQTGHSKHYAFIEFTSAEVAQIVSETMNNYLLMGHILQCRVIPKDQVHPELWVGANRKWRYVPHDRLVRLKHNRVRTSEEQERAEKKLIARQIKKQRKIKDKGIDYDIEPVGYRLPVEASA
ncbi:hypothetical protein Clacol_007654 [Clathrus columnatus]|uniref:RRM domain-containing protein n=1 Tax=Clathrus columnatus TaxID=1419009 RepID=A0AAV5AKK3_9AGAM|nr:hypothetical protein Clacol_007654 [Clathrus columnatus]